MVDFALTEERQMLQDTLRRYLADRYSTETLNGILQEDEGYSRAVWSELAELGVIGALFGEAEGGFGGAGFDLAVVFEEFGRAGVVEPFLDTAVLAGGLIADLGSDGQKAIVEEVIAGSAQLAFAHGEPDSRYELSRVSAKAEMRGDAFVLNGRKAVVGNGGNAQTLVVSARSGGDVADEAGISLFLVPADAPGLSRRAYPVMGGGTAAEIVLRDVEVPSNAALGAIGEAFPAIERRAAYAIAALCAEALGAMESAKDLTVDYLRTRKQFGRPLGKFQALQHRMADMLVEIEQARSAVINAAGHLDRDRATRERQVSAAKNLIGRVGRLVAEETIQMHGGIGMTQEYGLAHLAKRMVMVDHRFGDTDHHLERFIALARG
ncbi:MAG: acyl-CoA dehydrogenase family protein [Alphaproteobacteria bacterium]|nr:acyl-CoA dehydrogenase family protein [Alphaproteobacteria bacterium]MBO6862437.1 acyl-CoA dehydrogenase family protein [Alphaproteobacteria bacterium]